MSDEGQSNKVQIIDTGVANICSLGAAFERLGYEWSLTRDRHTIAESQRVLLPGVGAFAAAMTTLNEDNLCEVIVDRLNGNSPDKKTLAICLGLQLLCTTSEESPGVPGLGVIPHEIKRFSTSVQSPQLGWNQVTPNANNESTSNYTAGSAYFANSFRLVDPPSSWNYATTNYDGQFISSFWRGNVLACQFHPELSGQWGQQLLSKWLEGEICSPSSGH